MTSAAFTEALNAITEDISQAGKQVAKQKLEIKYQRGEIINNGQDKHKT
jgi:hypothetical protein